jgi:hypothetical protein
MIDFSFEKRKNFPFNPITWSTIVGMEQVLYDGERLLRYEVLLCCCYFKKEMYYVQIIGKSM